jgi:hypothetical protein
MSVDLDLFCDPERRNLAVPFSLNRHTYATNGHIIVRVPRRPDIPENKEAPNPEGLPWGFLTHQVRAVARARAFTRPMLGVWWFGT